MHRLNRLIVNIALVIALAAGSVAAHAQTSNGKIRSVTGIIVSIERNERTFTMRHLGTGRIYRVHVPNGVTLRIDQSSTVINFEQLLAGMTVRDLVVM